MKERLAEIMECDVCVIGAGPAGSTFARRMAQLGHHVVVVEKQSFPRPHIGESLPPSISPLLEQIGMREAVEEAGFLRPRDAIVMWPRDGSTTARREAPGFQVDRASFDHLLLRGARQAGVGLVQPGYPLLPFQPGPADSEVPGQPVEVLVRTPSRTVRLRSRLVADASGRRGVLGGIKERSAPRTMAVYGYWGETPLAGDETRVEARSDRWYWGAPLPDGSFNACVFLDPRHLADLTLGSDDAQNSGPDALSGRQSMERVYTALLERSRLLSACRQGKLLTEVEVCDATPTADLDPVNDYWVKLGEAALSIDPLSSQGVQAAIRGGLQGAATVHTILTQPSDAKWARRFYRDRCRETVEFHQQLSARYARRCLSDWNTPFWRDRAHGLPSSALDDPSLWNGTDPLSGPEPSSTVLSLLEPLRTQPGLKVALHPKTRFQEVPVLVDDLIRPFPALHHPSLSRPTAFLQGLPVHQLLDPLSQDLHASSLLESWNLPPRRALPLFAWLLEREVVLFKQD